MTLARVRYRERQRLRAADLIAEQAYRVVMRRRHNIAHHVWGIVSGLELALGGGLLILKPGMAVDGYGRELIVPEEMALPIESCDLGMNPFEVLGDEIDVWLLYGRESLTSPQAGREPCGPDWENRWREVARLRCTSGDTVEPRSPVEVPEEDLDFGPHELPPDDPEREWPVYLGRITCIDKDAGDYRLDLSDRPYVGLIGEEITVPAERARMQVGSEVAGDDRRFALCFSDDTGAWTDRLSIDSKGDGTIYGATTLLGDLLLDSQQTEPGQDVPSCPECAEDGDEPDDGQPAHGVEFGPMAEPPKEARPWQIYHSSEEKGKTRAHELRLEVEHPGDAGDPKQHRLAVGAWIDEKDPNPCPKPRKEGFQPFFSVAADCTVTVHGDLHIKGQISRGPVTADPSDPDFVEAVGASWVQGLTEAIDRIVPDTRLGVAIGDVTISENGLTMDYEVTVSNEGSTRISDITVIETLTSSGEPVRQEIVGHGFALDPGSDILISVDYSSEKKPLGPDIVIVVSALGVGPEQTRIPAWDTKQVPS